MTASLQLFVPNIYKNLCELRWGETLAGKEMRDLIRDGVGGGDVDRGRLPCEGGGAGVVVVVSLPDRTAEGEVAWESAAAISPCITTR